MLALIQKVNQAQVMVDNYISGNIGNGLIVYLGIHKDDTEKDISYVSRKISGIRVFADDDGKMNYALTDMTDPEPLIIPQFTLFGNAAMPDKAEFFLKI